MSEQDKDKLLLYYRTLDQMKAYRKVPVEQKFAWLQMQMEFYHECMSELCISLIKLVPEPFRLF